MRRRDFITGAAALAAYSQVRKAEAMMGPRRVLLGGAIPNPPVGFTFLQLSDGRYEQDAQGNYILVRV